VRVHFYEGFDSLTSRGVNWATGLGMQNNRRHPKSLRSSMLQDGLTKLALISLKKSNFFHLFVLNNILSN